MHHFYANWPYTSIYHQQRAWHLLWICMSLWQLKAGKWWEEKTMIAQAGRAMGHSTLRRCSSSPPHHFTQLLYWFCNWNIFPPQSFQSNSHSAALFHLCCKCVLHLCVHINLFHSTLTFQPNTYIDIPKIKLLYAKTKSCHNSKLFKIFFLRWKKILVYYNSGLNFIVLSIHPAIIWALSHIYWYWHIYW